MISATSIRRPLYSFGLLCLSISLVAAQAIYPYVPLSVAELVRGIDQQPIQQLQQSTSAAQQATNVQAVCPDANNNTYYTDTGIFYNVQCDRRQLTRTIQTVAAESLPQCIEKCADEPACKSVNYYRVREKECTLLSDAGASITDMELRSDYSHAYEVDPPVQAQDNEPIVPCSTSCPAGTFNLHHLPYCLC